MNRKKVLIIVFIIVLIVTTPVLISKTNKISRDMKITASVDYIENLTTGEKIYIRNIKTIKPTLWKGSYDGVLHYKDGRKVEIDISYYGNFFGIKGEERRMFSDGVLYEYTTN